MLSLTFCSWPESVWMTNHWLRMMLEFKEHEEPEENLINQDDKPTKQDYRNGYYHRRALQLIPRRPSALAQFFPRLLDVVSQLPQVPLPPADEGRIADLKRLLPPSSPSAHSTSAKCTCAILPSSAGRSQSIAASTPSTSRRGKNCRSETFITTVEPFSSFHVGQVHLRNSSLVCWT